MELEFLSKDEPFKTMNDCFALVSQFSDRAYSEGTRPAQEAILEKIISLRDAFDEQCLLHPHVWPEFDSSEGV